MHDVQVIGSVVTFRQQPDIAATPEVRGDPGQDPALMSWQIRAHKALQAVSRLCAPARSLDFDLGDGELLELPGLLGPVLQMHGIGTGATRLSVNEWRRWLRREGPEVVVTRCLPWSSIRLPPRCGW